ncbi:MAG: hypothetical protein IKK12_06065, partial [Clostridia bacterium]|nr:hypothetical protein [Clostridia bacterium]
MSWEDIYRQKKGIAASAPSEGIYSTPSTPTNPTDWRSIYASKTGNKAIVNSHNVFTLATVPLGASREDVYRTKYKGKSFNELNVILRGMDEGEEKDWLTQYTNSPEVMTQKDYENAISIAENQRDWYRRHNSPSADIEDTTVTQIYGRELSALDEELERLYAGLYQRENQDKYGSIRENADFARLSKATATEKGNGGVYDYINNVEGFRDYVTTQGRQGKGPNSVLIGKENWHNLHTVYDKYNYMTDEEKAEYNYIFNTQGRKEADEYLDFLSFDLDERAIAQQDKDAKAFADELPGLASALSIPSTFMSGAGLMDVAVQQAARGITGEYKPINYNSPAMGYSTFSTGVREGVSQKLIDKYGQIEIDSQEHPVLAKLLNGKSWADVYNLGMSMADSAALALSGFGPAASVLLGGAAGTQAMLEAVERGADDKQALTMGVLAGGFEALFEAIPLGKLEELIQGGAPSLIRAMASQGLTEGLEELGTGIANNVADILIMAENSNYEKNIAAYIESGLDPEEARKQALWDAAIEMGWDFVGGAVSGGIFGAGGYT